MCLVVIGATSTIKFYSRLFRFGSPLLAIAIAIALQRNSTRIIPLGGAWQILSFRITCRSVVGGAPLWANIYLYITMARVVPFMFLGVILFAICLFIGKIHTLSTSLDF